MTDVELLRAISEREQQNKATTKVTMSADDADELRASLLERQPIPEGRFGEAFAIEVWVEYDLKEARFE